MYIATEGVCNILPPKKDKSFLKLENRIADDLCRLLTTYGMLIQIWGPAPPASSQAKPETRALYINTRHLHSLLAPQPSRRCEAYAIVKNTEIYKTGQACISKRTSVLYIRGKVLLLPQSTIKLRRRSLCPCFTAISAARESYCPECPYILGSTPGLTV
jgi:hypothetical protein